MSKRIVKPIGTSKASAEATLRLLGHDIYRWKFGGTTASQYYTTSCKRIDCRERVSLARQGDMSADTIYWRLFIGYEFIDFGISSDDNENNTTSRSGACYVSNQYRDYILSLDADLFCTKFRCFK